MRSYRYRTSGTCSSSVLVTIDEDEKTIREISFEGGCSGNTQGVAALASGRTLDEVIPLLSGIRCGSKPTSCPDQLAQALLLIRDGKRDPRLREVEAAQ